MFAATIVTSADYIALFALHTACGLLALAGRFIPRRKRT
jgi:hypothetical protein